MRLRVSISFIILFSSGFIHPVVQAQAIQKVVYCYITGHCHDYYTDAPLSASIYAQIGPKKIKVTDCNKHGDFNALVPTNSTQIMLELSGYKPTKFAIHFSPNIIPNDTFDTWNWCQMIPNDSLGIPVKNFWSRGNFISLHYHYIDTLDIKNTILYGTKKDSLYIQSTLTYKEYIKSRGVHIFPIKTGNYIQKITTLDGSFLSEEELFIKSGITFKSVRISKLIQMKLLNQNLINDDVKMPQNSTIDIYFLQSSYELSKANMIKLDSVSSILVKQPNLRAKLTGYTDNVGNRELNMSLSEYRAKVVENYLKLHNVPPDQIIANWKGSDTKISSQDKEEVKAKSRRVVIQLAPR
jgi:OmpA family